MLGESSRLGFRRGGRLMSKLDELLKSTGANIDAAWEPTDRPPVARRNDRHGLARVVADAGLVRSKDAADIPVDRIDRDPEQPREEFDAEGLERLAQSLKTRGQLQPIRVRWDEGRGVYIIVCGERRWRAAKLPDCRP